jgi:hypothetical protein
METVVSYLSEIGLDSSTRRVIASFKVSISPAAWRHAHPRETILAALHARLSALPATALRGEVLPERVPAEGLLILRDGEPGEPEVTLSPLAYHYQHRAEIEAVVQGADRDAAFDTLTASIGAALAADRTLGGLCDWVEAEAPRPVDLPVEGAASLKAAVIPVVLHYSTADPLA